MKIVRIVSGKKPEYGILIGDDIDGIEGSPYHQFKFSNHHYNINEVKLLSPCTPSKIVALGMNYRSHAEELGTAIPPEPLLFMKPSTSVIGPEDNIIYPAASRQVDYEGELAVVIKRRAYHISVNKTLDYILGYTCFNDVTARDLQRKDGQWTRAKGFDTFSAIGPCIETELNPSNINIKTYLNGKLKQQGNTNNLVFSIPEIVSAISYIMTLLPGDVIATGTPSGIGPMQPGDTVEIVIKSIGTLRNKVIQES